MIIIFVVDEFFLQHTLSTAIRMEKYPDSKRNYVETQASFVHIHEGILVSLRTFQPTFINIYIYIYISFVGLVANTYKSKGLMLQFV